MCELLHCYHICYAEPDASILRAVMLVHLCKQLSAMAAGAERSMPFTVIVDDPSGNSFIENPKAPAKDLGLVAKDYVRSAAQVISKCIHILCYACAFAYCYEGRSALCWKSAVYNLK
jgi:hypothetical protein